MSLLYSFANANKASSAVRYRVNQVLFARGRCAARSSNDNPTARLGFAQFTQLRFG